MLESSNVDISSWIDHGGRKKAKVICELFTVALNQDEYILRVQKVFCLDSELRVQTKNVAVVFVDGVRQPVGSFLHDLQVFREQKIRINVVSDFKRDRVKAWFGFLLYRSEQSSNLRRTRTARLTATVILLIWLSNECSVETCGDAAILRARDSVVE